MSIDQTAVLKNQVELLYQHHPTILFGNLIVSAILAYLLWPFAEHQYILGWLACVYVRVIAFFFHYVVYLKKRHWFSDLSWARHYAFSLLISGIIWGWAAILFVDFSSPAFTIVIIMLCGMTAGCLASASAYPPAYVGFAIPCMSIMALAIYWDPEPESNVFTFLALIFLVANLSYSRNIYVTIRESIHLRLEHISLLESLRKEKEISEHASQSKSKFLAAASHDLRQPVHAMSIFADLLENQKIPATALKLVKNISRSISSLRGLFDNLLDISRLDANTVQAQNQYIMLNEVFADMQAQYDELAVSKGISYNVKETNFAINTDPILLRRILSNLLSNAMRYTDSGYVRLVATDKQGGIELTITDTGRGISECNQSLIFDEFHQLHNPERDRNKGLGLGLSICKRLAELIGTEIKVSSAVGKGSQFSFIVDKAANDVVPSAIYAEQPKNESLLDDKVIMVIDDEEDIRDAMSELLVRWGASKLICCSDGEEVTRALANRQDLDLILADYRLRNNTNGVDLINQIRENFSKAIPAILITGDTGPDALNNIRRSGTPFIHKPIKPAKLKLLIQRLL